MDGLSFVKVVVTIVVLIPTVAVEGPSSLQSQNSTIFKSLHLLDLTCDFFTCRFWRVLALAVCFTL